MKCDRVCVFFGISLGIPGRAAVLYCLFLWGGFLGPPRRAAVSHRCRTWRMSMFIFCFDCCSVGVVNIRGSFTININYLFILYYHRVKI